MSSPNFTKESDRSANDSSISAKTIAIYMGKLLLLQNKDGTYELPGGHIKVGEDILTGAKREFKEETGIDMVPVRILSKKPKRVIFYSKLKSRFIKLSHEHVGFRFVNINMIYSLKLSKKAYKDLLFLKK